MYIHMCVHDVQYSAYTLVCLCMVHVLYGCVGAGAQERGTEPLWVCSTIECCVILPCTGGDGGHI